MINNHTTLYQEIESHLNESNEQNVAKLLERDALLETEMNAFEASLGSTQVAHWNEIRRQVDELRKYAKLAKLRLLDGDEDLKSMVGRLRSSTKDPSDHDKAAIEIEREMHEYKGVKEVLQALFMWKPSPEEKLKEQAEEV